MEDVRLAEGYLGSKWTHPFKKKSPLIKVSKVHKFHSSGEGSLTSSSPSFFSFSPQKRIHEAQCIGQCLCLDQ